jgi:hypothetical protein
MHSSYSGLSSRFICVKQDFLSKIFLFQMVIIFLVLYKSLDGIPNVNSFVHLVTSMVITKSQSSHLQVTFLNHFQSKTRQRSSTTNPTVHDGRRSYSNSFTLWRGCTPYPHHPANHCVGTSPHNKVCHDKQPINNVSSACLSTNTTTKRCIPQHQCPIGYPGCAKSPAACHSGMILTLVES